MTQDTGLFSTSDPPIPTTPEEPPAGETISMPKTEAETNQDTSTHSENEVLLSLPDFRNVFKYGDNDDDVIANEGKKVSRSEADRILGLAEANGVVLLEKDVTN
jgi:hypothetical protein